MLKTYKKNYLPDAIEYKGKKFIRNPEPTAKYRENPGQEIKGAILVKVLNAQLKGKLNIHNKPYQSTAYIFTRQS